MSKDAEAIEKAKCDIRDVTVSRGRTPIQYYYPNPNSQKWQLEPGKLLMGR